MPPARSTIAVRPTMSVVACASIHAPRTLEIVAASVAPERRAVSAIVASPPPGIVTSSDGGIGIATLLPELETPTTATSGTGSERTEMLSNFGGVAATLADEEEGAAGGITAPPPPRRDSVATTTTTP